MSGESWGRYPKVTNQDLIPCNKWQGIEDSYPQKKVLPFGQGRSYGDVCLNEGGILLLTADSDRLISFDKTLGIIEADAGITLKKLLEFIVPHGWFLPVTPGTQYVSLAGAIANDVHGKNHHKVGTFGRFVVSFILERSNGEIFTCSAQHEADLFSATIGGMGLTGLIKSVKLQLRPITSSLIDMESIKFRTLNEFLEIQEDSDKGYEYTVAWLDCVNKWPNKGRGIFMRGNHSARGGLKVPKQIDLTVPFDLPNFALNGLSLSIFNQLYYNKQLNEFKKSVVPFRPFFYPLDAVANWNRIYGSRGFFQFQCVIPKIQNNSYLHKIMDLVYAYGKASFLAVIKEFGDIKSPAMLSFPRPGITLCLDFPNDGKKTVQLFKELEELVVTAQGALYPAKDALMSSESFKQFYPNYLEFKKYIDLNFSSNFWRRVSLE